MFHQKQAEIIAPAGDLEKLKFAIAYGADAVYCGLPAISLRARENEFTLDDLVEARRLTREAGVKMYLTCNIFPRGPQLAFIEKFAKEQLPEIQPDAVIFADPGVFSLVKKYNPEQKFHLSVQANNVNAASVRFWHEQGVRRVIVARELSKFEIAAIHEAVPEMELEAFVHGSICFTYSGRCLISNYLANRDGNRGTCANSCRWKWMEVKEGERPDQRFDLEEDEHGSYLFNSKDLCLIQKLPELLAAGVTGFKIEGRHKTVGYLGTIVRAYKKALSDELAGKPFDASLLREVFAVANRGYTLGFFDGSQKDLQNYERDTQENPQSFLGFVPALKNTVILNEPQASEESRSAEDDAEILRSAQNDKQDGTLFFVRNKFVVGDAVELVTPDGVFDAVVRGIRDENGAELSAVHGGRATPVWLDLGREMPPYSLLRKQAAAGDSDAYESQTGKICGGACHG